MYDIHALASLKAAHRGVFLYIRRNKIDACLLSLPPVQQRRQVLLIRTPFENGGIGGQRV